MQSFQPLLNIIEAALIAECASNSLNVPAEFPTRLEFIGYSLLLSAIPWDYALLFIRLHPVVKGPFPWPGGFWWQQDILGSQNTGNDAQ